VSYNAFMLQPVGPKAGSPGAPTSQDSAPPGSGAPGQQASPGGGSTLVMLAPILILMVVMLMMGRNQKKKDAEIRAKLKKGDRVVSQSGLIGELIEMDERFAKVKIAPGTNVQMLIGSIQPLEAPAAAASSKADDKQLKDLKEAKAAADKK
jgi:preprotein translocase subunit YajC